MWSHVLTTKLYLIAKQGFVSDLVNHTTTDAATIYHDAVGMETEVRVKDLLS